MNLAQHFDRSSLAVAALTLILFVAALFAKGFTHDLFLEAGVFLVSSKLIMMAYRNSVETVAIRRKLDEIQSALPQRGGEGIPHDRK